MTLRIYGVARTRAFRALWVAEELALDYEHLPIEIGDAGARTPEFLALNPNGRLPVIVDDGFRAVGIAGDHALSRQETFGRTNFIPPRSRTRRGSGNGASGRSPKSIAASTSGRCMRCACRRLSATRPCAMRRSRLAAPFKVLDAAVAGTALSARRQISPLPISTSPRSSAAPSTWILSAWPHLQGVARPLSRSARGARRAGAQDQIRQRHAGRRHAPHRPDQPAMSAMRGPFNVNEAMREAVTAASARPAARRRENLCARAQSRARSFRRAQSSRHRQGAAWPSRRGASAVQRRGQSQSAGAAGLEQSRPGAAGAQARAAKRSKLSTRRSRLAPDDVDVRQQRGNVLLSSGASA